MQIILLALLSGIGLSFFNMISALQFMLSGAMEEMAQVQTDDVSISLLYIVLSVAGAVVEELFFRGYLTSHYEKQTPFTPIIITVLFSLYHLWLPFNNLFRIFAFAPAAYMAYKKKNIYVSICFHCLCNLFSTLNFMLVVLG